VKSPLFSLFRKEVIHILRDRQSLFMVLTMPVLMLLLYGYAITLNMEEIDMVVVDQSDSPQSRELLRHITATDFFSVRVATAGVDNINSLFQRREAQCVLVIPLDFAETQSAGEVSRVQLAVDASDPNAAKFIENYVTQGVGESLIGSASLFSLKPRVFYNPDMRSAPFFVPGLIALILLLISTLLTSIAIVREKETGTMEQLLVSPVKPAQIIIGKVLPYTVLGFLDGLVILVVGSLLFEVPIQGSILLVMLMMLVYVVTGLSLGMLVSTMAKTQSVAMLVAITLTVLPSMLMSGFIFPITSMPKVLQWFSRVVPATYFLEIIRGIVLKGNDLSNLYRPAGILLGIDVVLIVLSIRTFRIRLE
jgi:ABC-2 type transport system permease protein